MICYWIVKGILSFPIFNNLNLSDNIINAFKSVIGFINSFSSIFNVDLLFTLLGSFFTILFLGFICSIVWKFLRR